MCRSARTVFAMVAVLVTLAVLVGTVAAVRSAAAQPAGEQSAEPAPPKDQTYAGAKECASCHFKQFMTWRKTGHSKSFELLPEQYQSDPECLKCHTTGYGQPTGYKSASDTGLKGTACEACHGPGSKHVEICKNLGKDKLTAEQEQAARDSIWLIPPRNVCVTCHVVQGHGKNPTPAELRTKK